MKNKKLRSRVVYFRVTEEEFAELAKKAKRAHKSLSEYMWMRIRLLIKESKISQKKAGKPAPPQAPNSQ